jgi:uncharacterized membrane protein YfcA
MKELIIFGAVNLLAAILSGASGGGGGLISTPLLVILGLSPAQAIATAKFGGFGISLGASSRFFREKITDGKTVAIFAAAGAVGALIGSLTLVHFSGNAEVLQKLMGYVLLMVGVPMLYLRRLGLHPRPRPLWFKVIGGILIFVTIMLQAALSSGTASAQTLIFISFFGMRALVASATKRAMQLAVASVSLTVFIIAGLVDYKFGAVALVTSWVGGFIGTHIAIKKGDGFVVNLFAVTTILLALELILG